MIQSTIFGLFLLGVHVQSVPQYPPVDRVPPTLQGSTWKTGFGMTAAPTTLGPLSSGCKEQSSWAMTFDDGPGPNTGRVLDELSKLGIKATFFVVGSRVLTYPDVLRRIYREGHEIALHSWSHASNFTLINEEQIASEMFWSATIVKETIGVTPTLFRPPYEAMNDAVNRQLTAMGFKIVLFNRNSFDYKFTNWQQGTKVEPPFAETDTPEAIVRLFQTWVQAPRNGTISLQHDLHAVPAAQVPATAKIVADSSYQRVVVSQCLGVTAYDEALLAKFNFSPPQDTSGKNPTGADVPKYNGSSKTATGVVGLGLIMAWWIMRN
jgi:peptidoglycan/xylan/chitin deacetylase (PgdA/CDA1 family)